jgi:hypothetical protein
VSLQLAELIGLDATTHERRTLQLKGKTKPFEVAVVRL